MILNEHAILKIEVTSDQRIPQVCAKLKKLKRYQANIHNIEGNFNEKQLTSNLL